MLSVRSLSAATLSIDATKLSVTFWTSFSALKRSSSPGSAFTAAIASFLAVLTARRAVSASFLHCFAMASKVSEVGLCVDGVLSQVTFCFGPMCFSTVTTWLHHDQHVHLGTRTRISSPSTTGFSCSGEFLMAASTLSLVCTVSSKLVKPRCVIWAWTTLFQHALIIANSNVVTAAH